MPILMNTENQNLQSMLGNGHKYKVPSFQRDYSWSDEQWEDLWVDIETLDEEGQHYIGYVVLQAGRERELIIDGQQRLTTLSIIILAALKRLNELTEGDVDNQKRAEIIRNSYIGSFDSVSLNTYNKLELNRNNNIAYRQLSALKRLHTRKQKKTNKLMINAFEFFYNKLQGKKGKEIAEYVEKMSRGLIFTKIIVTDELNAYKVFETLNARGVQLSTSDLLKNYLFSVINKGDDISDDELERLDERWEGIVAQLGSNDFSHFLRTDWNSRFKTATKNELFKKIRSLVRSRADAYEYLERIEQNVEVYAALSRPDDELWREAQHGQYRECAEELRAFELLNINQPYNIFLAAFKAFNAKEFIKLLRYIKILSLRYNTICNKLTKDQERSYNDIAIKIALGAYKRAAHIKNSFEFKKLYPDDEAFILAFKYKTMPFIEAKKKIKFILAEIEDYLSKKCMSKNLGVTIEHILPTNPDGAWISRFGENWEDAISRLGNMVFLKYLDNKDASRLSFKEKKEIYKQSDFLISQRICGYEEWNNESLNDYQEWLGKQAAQAWHLEFK
ncbi:MAG: hypothetical protein K0Q74_18 [Gammaproteobacteria bacterium]|jgi:uncharacterized protein with ParB-like and HNH nuclease domain|nr:hypothetical protein [Gammaproteobacteria bacterium]